MLKIKKGDNVQMMLGKDAGKTGVVERVLIKDSMVLINGLNLFKRHVRKYQGMEGGIIDIPKPVIDQSKSTIGKCCFYPPAIVMTADNYVFHI